MRLFSFLLITFGVFSVGILLPNVPVVRNISLVPSEWLNHNIWFRLTWTFEEGCDLSVRVANVYLIGYSFFSFLLFLILYVLWTRRV
jgi:hypothetical protein